MGRDVVRFFRTQVTIAVGNLVRDFNNGFFPLVQALMTDLRHAGGRFLTTLAHFNMQVAEGVWNDIKDKLQRAKDNMKAGLVSLGRRMKGKLKEIAQGLGQKALQTFKTRVLRPLWEWVKSDWHKITRWISENISPQFLSRLANFIRNELNEHPQVRERFEDVLNGVNIHVSVIVVTIILTIAGRRSLRLD